MCSKEHKTTTKEHKKGSELMNLGEMIRSRRESLMMTQAELARRTGFTRPQITRWEQGRTKGIKVRSLVLLERALGFKPGDLFKTKYEDLNEMLRGN